MENLLLEIVNQYYLIDENLSNNFMKKHKIMFDRIDYNTFPLQRDLTKYIILCFVLNPIKPSQWKVYKKLSPNQRVGFISRKLMGMARNLGISQTNIREFKNAKYSWKHYKKRIKVKDDEVEYKVKEALLDFHEKKSIRKVRNLFVDEERLDNSFKEMFHQTKNLVELILEKSAQKLDKELREYKLSID